MKRLNLRAFGFDRFSGLYFWAAFFVIFAIWTPHLFLTESTLYSVADSQAVAAMLALAIVVPLAGRTFDLAIGATAGLCGIFAVELQDNLHVGVWVAIACAVALGVFIGAVNGFIVVRLKVNSFITTLGTASIIAAFQVIVTGSSQPLRPTSPLWSNLTQNQLGGGFQLIVVYMLVLAVIVWWALEKTPMGRYMYAIGGNPEAARLTGINVGGWTWISLIISGGLSGLAGVFYTSQNGPSLTFGPALLLPAFAAAFLGSTQLKPGKINVWGTVVAVYILATGVKGLQLVTGVRWLGDMFNGTALVVAVAFAVWAQRSGVARPRKPPVQTNSGDPSANSKPAPVRDTESTIVGMDERGATSEVGEAQ
jgi:ribose transport system permease protein